MSDIFREVDEALQKEKAERFWKEWGSVLISAAVLLVLSTAATTAYHAWDKSRDEKETAKLLAALQSEEPVPALQAAAQDTRMAQETMAKMISASMMVQNGQIEKAAQSYKSLFENQAAPDPFDAIARILYVRTSLSLNTKPGADEMLVLLAPVIEDAENPYKWQARLDAAMINGALKGDYVQALSLLKPFAEEENLQQNLKDRAAKLSQLYTKKSQQNAIDNPQTTQ